ncbi:MAG: hypothetical protein AAGA56_29595 [Myxococcota bacterium]
MSDRTAVKGERDLLVVLGMLLTSDALVLERVVHRYRMLPDELQHAVRSNLTILSLARPHAGMPDPGEHRELVANLLIRLEDAT